jgi:outer membrane protein assembly factor BamB
MLSTAGGLVFGSNPTGELTAYDAKNLDVLWSFNVGTGLSGPPITYGYDGKQYIAVLAGRTPSSGAIEADPSLNFYTPQDQLYVFTND